MRYVVLHHTGWQGRADHYDLMMETTSGGSDDERSLKTFATLADTFQFSGDGEPLPLKALPDHRRAYLDFSGPLSGGRGLVERYDAGEFEMLASPGSNDLRIRFNGEKLNGLFRIHSDVMGRHYLIKEDNEHHEPRA